MRSKLIQTAIRSMLAGLFLVVLCGGTLPSATAGSLQDEFDRICIYTQDAETLPTDRLQELISQCDTLQEQIVASDDPKKKVLLFRLKKCRDFFNFVIDQRSLTTTESAQ